MMTSKNKQVYEIMHLIERNVGTLRGPGGQPINMADKDRFARDLLVLDRETLNILQATLTRKED